LRACPSGGGQAYLRSLYKMGAADTQVMLRDQIRFPMEKTLVTGKDDH
jgi:hypothetical protein